MEENTTNKKIVRSGFIHFILSHVYLSYLFIVIIGVILDLIFSTNIFEDERYQYIGLILMIFGTAVIYWAQATSGRIRKEQIKEDKSMEFNQGPYKVLHHPTYFGLSVTIIGLGLLINSFFTVCLIVVNFIANRFFFIKKEEGLLQNKYGEKFSKYKGK